MENTKDCVHIRRFQRSGIDRKLFVKPFYVGSVYCIFLFVSTSTVHNFLLSWIAHKLTPHIIRFRKCCNNRYSRRGRYGMLVFYFFLENPILNLYNEIAISLAA